MRYQVYAILVLISLLFGCASSEEFIQSETELKNYKRLAVMPLVDYPNEEGSGLIVADYISMNLMMSNLYVLDRAQTAVILEEQSIGQSGVIDENTALEVD